MATKEGEVGAAAAAAPAAPFPNGRGPRSGAPRTKPTEIYQSMPVPGERIGWIIGKSGAYIQARTQHRARKLRRVDRNARSLTAMRFHPTQRARRAWRSARVAGSP